VTVLNPSKLSYILFNSSIFKKRERKNQMKSKERTSLELHSIQRYIRCYFGVVFRKINRKTTEPDKREAKRCGQIFTKTNITNMSKERANRVCYKCLIIIQCYGNRFFLVVLEEKFFGLNLLSNEDYEPRRRYSRIDLAVRPMTPLTHCERIPTLPNLPLFRNRENMINV
jgi:hypothetical protein